MMTWSKNLILKGGFWVKHSEPNRYIGKNQTELVKKINQRKIK